MNPAINSAHEHRAEDFVPDIDTARNLLGFLSGLTTDGVPVAGDGHEPRQLAGWLVNNELGPLAQAALQTACPELVAWLQADAYAAAAQNALHWRNLAAIDVQLAQLNIETVLLKGAALAATVYERPEQRPMVDVDLWSRQQDIGPVCRVMSEQGFDNLEKADRPLALQALADGEVQFLSHDQPPTLVEVHLSPYAGWWLLRTSSIDKDAIWSRKEKLRDWRSFYQLTPEDGIIHTAVHLAVNHQFGLSPLRSLMDIALIDRVCDVDWQIVANRAREWRVATAVWMALYMLQKLFGRADLEEVLQELQPPAWKRRQLLALVSPESVLAGIDLRDGRARYRFLLLLVDRARDAGKLVLRTLWPEQEWLVARYRGQQNHWQHLSKVILQGDI